MKSIGIAGTAKNTGKTTTLSAVMQALAQRDIRLALTGIGYDGEAMDTITGLPKPRLLVQAGDIVAVAQRCISASEAGVEVLEDTGIRTAMGHILICRATRPGKLVLAGPNKRSELREVLDRLALYGAQLCMVDGAINRMAPFVEADGLILATGAARHTDISGLARESGLLMGLFGLPQRAPCGQVRTIASVLAQRGFASLTNAAAQADTLQIDGVIACEYLRQLAEMPMRCERILFEDAVKLLLAGPPEQVHAALHALRQRGVEVGVRNAIRVLCMTVNPYYPQYRYNGAGYDAAFVDRDELLACMRESVQVPCYDVVRQGAEGIADAILRELNK